MSSVVVWSQLWVLELSVEFFNVNCKWQLAAGRQPLLSVDHSRLFAVANNLAFIDFVHVKIGILMFSVRNVFFDPVDIQASKQFILATLVSARKRINCTWVPILSTTHIPLYLYGSNVCSAQIVQSSISLWWCLSIKKKDFPLT